jgi:hypothetical protein
MMLKDMTDHELALWHLNEANLCTTARNSRVLRALGVDPEEERRRHLELYELLRRGEK